ncbi:MAG: hypothetical protein HY820_23400 [Acidobacteria bacterium]|nr:hypothetical protein [Acidobacteriota bacterium]
MPKLSKSDIFAKVSQNEARRRKEVALAELREMEVAKLRGELVARDAVSDAVTKAFGMVKAAVLRIPDKSARHVMAAGTPKEARDILLADCEGALKGAHDELAKFAG